MIVAAASLFCVSAEAGAPNAKLQGCYSYVLNNVAYERCGGNLLGWQADPDTTAYYSFDDTIDIGGTETRMFTATQNGVQYWCDAVRGTAIWSLWPSAMAIQYKYFTVDFDVSTHTCRALSLNANSTTP
jgi:hypothetical protein